MRTALAYLSLGFVASIVDAAPVKFNDPKPQAYHLTVRASEVDPSAKSYPDIEFGLESKGKPADVQTADVDTRVASRPLATGRIGANSGSSTVS